MIEGDEKFYLNKKNIIFQRKTFIAYWISFNIDLIKNCKYLVLKNIKVKKLCKIFNKFCSNLQMKTISIIKNYVQCSFLIMATVNLNKKYHLSTK